MSERANNPRAAAQTLGELRAIQGDTRRRLQSFWFPLLVFGALLIASAPFFALLGGSAVALYWLVAAPSGWLAVRRHYRHHALEVGLMGAKRVYEVIGWTLIVACFGLGFAGGISGVEEIALFGPPLAIALAYLALAAVEHSTTLAVLAVALGGLSVSLLVADAANPGPILAITYGTGFVAVGLLARAQHRS